MYLRRTDPTAGVFVHGECLALKKKGFHFRVLSPLPYSPRLLWRNAKWERLGRVPRSDMWDGIAARYPRYLRPPGAYYRKVEPFVMLPRLCTAFNTWSRERPFDLIHAHGLLPCGVAATFLSRIFRVPCICHARGSDVNLYSQKSRMDLALTRYAIDHCDTPVAVSQDLANKMSRISRRSREVTVLYTTVDTGLFRPAGDKADLRESHGIPVEAFVAIYVGHLFTHKGVEDLARVWPRVVGELPGSLLIVIGEGSLSGRFSRLGPGVLLCGPQPHDRVSAWMRLSDALVLPSHTEGMPTVVAEAMACGLPVVATPVGGTPEAVVHGETGILTPVGDGPALISALVALAQNETLRRSMGDAARRRALAMFGGDSYARRVQQIYSALLGGKPHSRPDSSGRD